MLDILFQLAYYVINLFKWAVILAAILSILTAFGVLDTRNRLVWTIGDFLYRVTEPGTCVQFGTYCLISVGSISAHGSSWY